MATNRGHLYLAFGSEYDKAAAFSVKALRKHSNLTVCVLTNLLAEQRHKLWKESKDVLFQYIKSDEGDNRDIKTQMDLYSPFDETLYTDCDTVIHSDRFMVAFDLLAGCDVAFPAYTQDESNSRLATSVYQQAIREFGLKGNLLVYQGGICAFRKNQATRSFFTLWNSYWKVHKFRDMPPLVAAVHNCRGVVMGILPHEFGFPDSRIIQHFYGHKPPKTDQIPQFVKLAADEKRMQWIKKEAFR